MMMLYVYYFMSVCFIRGNLAQMFNNANVKKKNKINARLTKYID